MNYSAALEDDLADLERAAVESARGDGDKRDLVAALDHLLNTYLISEARLLEHIDEIRRIYETRRNENTASKHVDTVHEAFLAEVCVDYDPTY
ncbi:MAG: hypothetical protein ABEI27_08890 [Halobellus sp.]|uniref:hypothetical protein n=1 Tax=Halobellus sp. TaxID=1979212 RepID=UPI0035D489F3